jgi:hypothetical protein
MAYPAACLTALLVSMCLGWPALASAQPRERVAFVSVVDRTGNPLTELTPGDIVVREDRVTREVLRVSRATGPMPIAVLVDNSAAAEAAIPDIRAALTSFVAALGDVGPVALISMGERPTVIADYSTSREAIASGIARVFSRPGSGATLLDAVSETANGLGKVESERAAIVLVSVNGVEHSNLHATRALERLKQSGAALHAVVLSTPGAGSLDDARRQRDTLLDRGVRETGGLRRDVLSSMSMSSALGEVARVLTQQFRVVYARPQTLIPPDSFEVAAAAPGHIAYGAPARGNRK